MANKTPYDWSSPHVGLLTPHSCEIPVSPWPWMPTPPTPILSLHPFHLKSVCFIRLEVSICAKLFLSHSFPARVHPSHVPFPLFSPHRAHGAKFFYLNLIQDSVFCISGHILQVSLQLWLISPVFPDPTGISQGYWSCQFTCLSSFLDCKLLYTLTSGQEGPVLASFECLT